MLNSISAINTSKMSSCFYCFLVIVGLSFLLLSLYCCVDVSITFFVLLCFIYYCFLCIVVLLFLLLSLYCCVLFTIVFFVLLC